ncbi:MAG: Dipeptide and tripeptide permease A [Candidatus Anoxychlamydiales bacterium]|nr:Dipeptide and tripeptide permease A [Candidatus Anoxychlamydiales bacterium]
MLFLKKLNKDYNMYTKQELHDQKIGTSSLYLIQLFSTFSYGILYSTLILFITKGLKMDDVVAATITASFIAFNYTLRLIAGFISGKFFSHRISVVIGSVFQGIGCFFLYKYELYIGLAFYLVGLGFTITCINCLLTQFYHKDDKNREKVFMFNYSIMNFGFLIAYFISGYFEKIQNYKLLFLISAISNIIPLILLLFFFKFFKDKKTTFSSLKISKRTLYRILGAISVVLITICLIWLIRHSTISHILIIVLSIAMFLLMIFYSIVQKTKIQKEKLWAFLILTVMSIIFWTLYTAIPMALTLFIENNVDRNILGFIVPPQWVLSINTILIVVGGPLLAIIFKRLRHKGRKISLPFQFSVALFLIGFAFLFLGFSTNFASKIGLIGFYWIVIGYFLQTVGELYIAPVSYAMVGQLVPDKLQNIMMGITMLTTGIAAIFSNMFARIALGSSKETNPLITNPHFAKMFYIMGGVTIVAGIIMTLLIPLINNLIKEKDIKKTSPELI